MIDQIPPPETDASQKTGRTAAKFRQQTSGLNDFARVLSKESAGSNGSNKEAALEAAKSGCDRSLSDHAAPPPELARLDVLIPLGIMVVLDRIDVLVSEQVGLHIASLQTGVDADQLPGAKIGLHWNKEGLAPENSRPERIPETDAQRDRIMELYNPGAMPPRSVAAKENVTLVGVKAEEGSGLVADDKDEQDFFVSNPLRGDRNSDDRAGGKPGFLTRERYTTVDNTVQVLAALPVMHADAAPSPARQILTQLEVPIAAAARETAGPEEAAPLRHLKICLRPDDLGTISVTLRMQDKMLKISIEASVPETADLLQKDRGLLEEVLRPVIADGGSAVVTIVIRDVESTGGGFNNSGSGEPAPPNSREPGTGRERSTTGKESSPTQADERTPADEELFPVRRSLPGILVL